MEEARKLFSAVMEGGRPQTEAAAEFLSRNWRAVLATAAGAYLAAGFVGGKVRLRRTKQKIARRQEEAAKQRRRMREELQLGGELVDEAKRAVLEMDIKELAEKLRSGQLRPTEVLKAYQVCTERKN